MSAKNGAGLDHCDGDEAREIEDNIGNRSLSPSLEAAQAPASKRKARHEVAIGVLLMLRRRWPQTFARLNARARRPLKVGIAGDLLAALPDIPPALISIALAIYANSASYFAACIEGAPRIDLDGKSAGVVSPDEAAHARAQLDKCQRREKPKASPAPEAPRRVTFTELRAAAARRRQGAAS